MVVAFASEHLGDGRCDRRAALDGRRLPSVDGLGRLTPTQVDVGPLERRADVEGVVFACSGILEILPGDRDALDRMERVLEKAVARFRLSPRAVHRILKVARTIADLDAQELIQAAHLQEAINYRCLDKAASASGH